MQKFPIIVLVSGNGSNLQALIDDAKTHKKYQIKAVISNNPEALGLHRAKRENIKTYIINHREFKKRDDFDHAVLRTIQENNPELIVLAGFMRKLGPELVNHFAGKMINIHPSLLPKFPGLNTHQKAIDAEEKEHGCSIHFVTCELDSGPILAQARTALVNNAALLQNEVQKLEHKLLPLVVNWFAERRVRTQEGIVYLNGRALATQGFQLP